MPAHADLFGRIHTVCMHGASIVSIIVCHLNSGTVQGCGINCEGQDISNGKRPKVSWQAGVSCCGKGKKYQGHLNRLLSSHAVENCQGHLHRLLSHAGGH